jgi:hypothetical protein
MRGGRSVRLGTASVATLGFALLLCPVASSAGTVHHLQAWAKFWRSPAVSVARPSYFDGTRVKHVRPGRYQIAVYATDMLGFQLVGPGVNRHTPVALIEHSSYKIINVTWTLRLRPGVYQYRGIGPYAPTSRDTTGSFRVP